MCGLCGVFAPRGGPDITSGRLRAMADTIRHRGPDDDGTYVSPDGRVGFGFRRLSIVDVVGGHQPMSNEDGTIWIVFNGEIYNHAALRRELESRGHVFRTRSDTESIVHAYEEWGQECVHRLRGMFAFAIHDGRPERRATATLLLARDRLGVKPLYYAQAHGVLTFASEIKAILAWGSVPREVDEEALYHYLSLSATPAPKTMFAGISKLPPGHILTVADDGTVALCQYWEPLFPDDGVEAMAEDEIARRLRSLLRESIRLRMMSDVPFGVFLSGGLDSSLNVALMSELMDQPVRTFSVTIAGDPASDERVHARRVADLFGARHHEVVISAQDFIETLPRLIHHQDEPLADPVCVPLYFVSKLARDHGTIVVQVGEGADELFAGYRGYAVMDTVYRRLYRPFAVLPGRVGRPAAALLSAVATGRRAEYARRAAAGQELFWGGAAAFSEEAKRRILSNGAASRHDTHAQVIARLYGRFDAVRPEGAFLDRLIYFELRHRLPELLLMRVDKMSMATSVEARVPYLDHELVRFALAIPAHLKHRRGRTKHILKEAARGILPDEVIDRPKTGFCGGPTNMVAGPVLDYAERTVLGSPWVAGFFDLGALHQVFADHRRKRPDRGMEIWNLLTLTLWHRHWIEQADS